MRRSSFVFLPNALTASLSACLALALGACQSVSDTPKQSAGQPSSQSQAQPSTTKTITKTTMSEQTDTHQDPHLWLEDVTGDKQLDWVKAHNAKTATNLASSQRFDEIKRGVLQALDSDDKIPFVQKRGDYYYNFWTDAKNQRGIWRRTTLDEYKKDKPNWEVLLDLDALNAAEGENWVWHGADCLEPDYTHCLVALSRGGADADVTREFDLTTKRFVTDGFVRPEAKGELIWIDKDTVYLTTVSDEASATTSGYARTARLWRRGTPMQVAPIIFEIDKDHMAVSAGYESAKGFERGYLLDIIDFYNHDLYVQDDKTAKPKKVTDLPTSIVKSIHKQYLGLKLREDWTLDGKTYKAGSYLVTNLDDWLAGKRQVMALYEPSDNASLSEVIWTKNFVVINVLEDVKTRLVVLKQGTWQKVSDETQIQGIKMPHIDTWAVDDKHSDELWLSVSSYTAPVTLSMANLTDSQKVLTPHKIKAMPKFFEGDDFVVEQFFATSDDGTRVPYFLVHHKDMKTDGQNPTLLYGYGGFEVSLTPMYSSGVGRGWLSRTDSDGRHGVYVVANIRGGGEYGPRWHQAALKENRHRAYEDFAAVAKDLIARGITSPAKLGVQGGSNGGLLTGNMYTQYPELFGAVVIQVPLLDMQRYHKLLAGASWMAEYGDSGKPEDWAHLQRFSPYHLFDADKHYPPVFIATSTRDDRVHPGHARKMMAKLVTAGKQAHYYENIEGGHGGAANNEQRAHMSALAFEFLWQELGK